MFFFFQSYANTCSYTLAFLKSHKRPTVAPNWAGAIRTLSPRCHSSFYWPCWPTLHGSKSTQGTNLPDCLPPSPPAQEKPVCRLCCCRRLLRGVALWSDLFSLSLPPLPPPMPSYPLSHEKLTWRHLHTQRPILAADWPGVSGPASGLPHQWRQRLRDSQGEDKLLHDTSPFSAPNSSHCVVFSFFLNPPPPPAPPAPPL